MKTFIILGAGQFGRTSSFLFNTGEWKLLAFGDNNQKLWGTFFTHPLGMEIPIMSIEDAVSLSADCALLGVIDDTRSGQMKEQALTAGFSGTFASIGDYYHQLDIRSSTLLRLASRMQHQNLNGAVAELGVYKGETAWKLNALFPERPLYLFDTFEGFDTRDIEEETNRGCSRAQKEEFADTSAEAVLSRMPYPEQVIIRKGFFPETAAGLEDQQYMLVSLDADLYAPTLAGLEYFYPRLCKGGVILLHDYNNERFRGAKQAVNEYEEKCGPLLLVPLSDLHGTAVIIHP